MCGIFGKRPGEEGYMKFRKKYLFPPFLTLFWFALGGALVLLVDIGVSLTYDYLCEIMPAIFYRPGPITDPEGYERVYRGLTLTVIALTVLPATYFSMRLDNNRFEYIVTLTEGLYPIRERDRAAARQSSFFRA